MAARSNAPEDAVRSGDKYVFVTVGASASFRPLIEEVLSGAFLGKLRSLRFTHLVVQCGPDFEYFEAAKPRRDPDDPDALVITGFPFTNDIDAHMSRTTAAAAPAADTSRGRAQGLIITHAGSGSILSALQLNTNVIAVPNPALMGNHQQEIAEEMERQGFLTQGKLGRVETAQHNSSLADLITEEILNAPRKQWPPEPDPDSMWPGGLWDVIDALMPAGKSDGSGSAAAELHSK
ncbi:N-acetylglucosaminyldiphosphodolichol N-acetylglucosaminyltransferase catalytic subunit alg13 [Parahypoxylon ruwenzoriense]